MSRKPLTAKAAHACKMRYAKYKGECPPQARALRQGPAAPPPPKACAARGRVVVFPWEGGKRTLSDKTNDYGGDRGGVDRWQPSTATVARDEETPCVEPREFGARVRGKSRDSGGAGIGLARRRGF